MRRIVLPKSIFHYCQDTDEMNQAKCYGYLTKIYTIISSRASVHKVKDRDVSYNSQSLTTSPNKLFCCSI